MTNLNFFVKRVKNIINENSNYLKSIELLEKEVQYSFSTYFSIFSYNGVSIYSGKGFKISNNELKNIMIHKENIFNINISEYLNYKFEYIYGGICPFVEKEGGLFILFYNKNTKFNDDEMCILEMLSNSIFLLVKKGMLIENLKTKSDIDALNKAIDSLSYSEYEAVGYILSSFLGDECIIVASSIAKEKNITRSVIVTGLKKLTNANIIKSYSVGNKGTYIKILNMSLREKIR